VLLGAASGAGVLATSLALDVAVPSYALLAAAAVGAAAGLVTQVVVAWSPTLAWTGAFLLLTVALMTVTSVVPPGALPSWVVGIGAAWPGTWLALATDGVASGVPWVLVGLACALALVLGRAWVRRGRTVRA
jgi:hypothetical protein